MYDQAHMSNMVPVTKIGVIQAFGNRPMKACSISYDPAKDALKILYEKHNGSVMNWLFVSSPYHILRKVDKDFVMC